jgi:hypothetical protein
MKGIRQGLGDDQRVPDALVRSSQFSEDIVVALLEKRKVEDDVPLVGAFEIVLDEV